MDTNEIRKLGDAIDRLTKTVERAEQRHAERDFVQHTTTALASLVAGGKTLDEAVDAFNAISEYVLSEVGDPSPGHPTDPPRNRPRLHLVPG